jgi:hypothetical protein
MPRWLRTALGELRGLFVDDGSLALFAAVLIGLVAAAVLIIGVPALYGAIAIFGGLIGILAESLARASRPSRAGRKR